MFNTQDVIIAQVKSLISKAIVRFSKELECKPEEVNLFIYAKNDEGDPGLKLMKKGKFVKDLQFSDLYRITDFIMYSSLGFRLDTGLPEWIKKFIIKSQVDNDTEMNRLTYVIIIYQKDLRAFLYKDGIQNKEISMEYILTTN